MFDGKEFACALAGGQVRIHDTRSDVMRRILADHSSEVNAVTYSCDGTLLATGSYDCSIIVWNVEAGTKLHKLRGHTSQVTSDIFLADGKYVV